ncbi:MAG: hypothetical protein HUU35_16420, partial [Armatimonadetes bacterium]|nr:hypothetical protein [Armatimonadota bacterium]
MKITAELTMGDPRQFGAVGDGAVDCTEAITRAAAAGGGLQFAPGRYRISAPITMELDRHGPLPVSGPGATLVMAGAGPALRLL